jgi:hypothetical protein
VVRGDRGAVRAGCQVVDVALIPARALAFSSSSRFTLLVPPDRQMNRFRFTGAGLRGWVARAWRGDCGPDREVTDVLVEQAYVANTGPAFPLLISAPGGRRIQFSEYGATSTSLSPATPFGHASGPA